MLKEHTEIRLSFGTGRGDRGQAHHRAHIGVGQHTLLFIALPEQPHRHLLLPFPFSHSLQDILNCCPLPNSSPAGSAIEANFRSVKFVLRRNRISHNPTLRQHWIIALHTLSPPPPLPEGAEVSKDIPAE
ncbi:hypothetical protein ES708_04760 [subsurface metagenome]